MLTSICVFCGSSPGRSPAFADAAAALGTRLAQNGQTLVYGGSNLGLMRRVADASLSAGGRVVGVMLQALSDREVAHAGLSELRIVETFHERKALMADLADGFVAMPGGIGTLDELFEVWTWSQLDFHAKPIALLNVDGFFDPLLTYLEQVADQRFMRPEHLEMLVADDDPARLLTRMADYRAPRLEKWMDRETEMGSR